MRDTRRCVFCRERVFLASVWTDEGPKLNLVTLKGKVRCTAARFKRKRNGHPAQRLTVEDWHG